MIVANVQSRNIDLLAVQVLDVFETGGVQLASVRATSGKPFVGGDRWPIRTEFTTVKASDLQDISIVVALAEIDRQSVATLAAG